MGGGGFWICFFFFLLLFIYSLFLQGIVVDDAKVLSTDRQSDSGVIHTISKVLIPPEQTLMGLIQADPTLR